MACSKPRLLFILIPCLLLALQEYMSKLKCLEWHCHPKEDRNCVATATRARLSSVVRGAHAGVLGPQQLTSAAQLWYVHAHTLVLAHEHGTHLTVWHTLLLLHEHGSHLTVWPGSHPLRQRLRSRSGRLWCRQRASSGRDRRRLVHQRGARVGKRGPPLRRVVGDRVAPLVYRTSDKLA